MTLFDFIPSKLYAAAVATLLAALGWTTVSLYNSQKESAQLTARIARAEADAAEARTKAEQVQREKETAINNLNTKLVEKTNEHLKDKEAAVARVTAQSSKLRDAAYEVARKTREECAAAQSGSNLQTSGSSADLLANVLGRINQRAAELAAVADEARIRGLACEAQYDATQKVVNRD